MSTNRTYDPEIQATAEVFPRFNVADAEGTRQVLADMLEASAASGVERPDDPNI